jgi:hypothetical protein
MLATEKGSSTLQEISDDLRRSFNDGKRIFTTRLRFYPEKSVEESMISFKQLCYKDLGFVRKLHGKSEVKTAIVSTMVFELEVLDPLIVAQVPVSSLL